jgi:hypothetical protein
MIYADLEQFLLPVTHFGSRGKAPEDWCTLKRFANQENHRVARSVLECGGPPPLFPTAFQTSGLE